MIGRGAIVGVGQTRIGKLPHLTTLDLLTSAADAALADAGLEVADVDGLLTTPSRSEGWSSPANIVADHLALEVRALATVDAGGASGLVMIAHALGLVATGQARVVLCVGGQSLLSAHGRAAAVASMASDGPLHPKREVPFGPIVPTTFALAAQRYLHEHHLDADEFAAVSVLLRTHAAANPDAHLRDPLSVDDVINARMISTPLRLYDCAPVSDGAVAVVVADRTAGRDPVAVLGISQASGPSYISDGADLVSTSAVLSAARAFDAARTTPDHVDLVQLYDNFTISVAVQLEDMGFCPPGGSLSFIADGGGRIDGPLPISTHGGLLSAGHPGVAAGLLAVVEAVRQLRGEAGARQVHDAGTAVVHGAGGMLSLNCTAVLGRSA